MSPGQLQDPSHGGDPLGWEAWALSLASALPLFAWSPFLHRVPFRPPRACAWGCLFPTPLGHRVTGRARGPAALFRVQVRSTSGGVKAWSASGSATPAVCAGLRHLPAASGSITRKVRARPARETDWKEEERHSKRL